VLYKFFLCSAFFVCTFIGNFEYDGFFVGPVVILLLFLVVLATRRRINVDFLSISSALSMILLVSYIFSGGDEYYSVFFLLLSYSFFFSALYESYDFSGPASLLFFAALSLFLCAGMIYAGGNIGGRESFIFGPNNLYRIFSVCLVFILFSPIKSHFLASLCRAVFAVVSILGVILTGSRGGLVVLAVVFFIYIIRSAYKFNVFYLLLSLLSSVFAAFVIYAQVGQSRLFNFSFSQGSISVRLDAYDSLSNFSELSLKHILFGYPNFKDWTYIMPHNFFLESVLAFGLVFSMLMIAGVVFYFSLFVFRLKTISSSALCIEASLIVIFIGAMFSGTFYDNYPAMMLSVLGVSFTVRRFVRGIGKYGSGV
jgi:hypothetical protein